MIKRITVILFFVFLSVFIAEDAQGETAGSELNELNITDISNVRDPEILWRYFLFSSDTDRKTEIIIALGSMGRGNRTIIDNINNYLMGMNLLFRTGSSVHYTIVSACISAIMELGDSTSYPALLSVLYAGYPEVIASEAYGALEEISGNLFQFLLNVINNNSPEEKFVAFRAGINSEQLTVSERGRLAERALEQSLADTEDNIYFSSLRYAAVAALTSLRWTRANALAIRHYYRVQSDFLQDNVSKQFFIEAITCLGAVGNSDAALVLGLQLGLINARTESTGSFDPDITMAIVRALGNIGFNAAFDHLLSVSSLPYPEDIVAAAGEAIARLRW